MGIGEGIQISQVKHRTYVDVNEEGTEAATVTGVAVTTTSVQPAKDVFNMDVNKPFFVAVRGEQTKAVLFAGAIHRP